MWVAGGGMRSRARVRASASAICLAAVAVAAGGCTVPGQPPGGGRPTTTTTVPSTATTEAPPTSTVPTTATTEAPSTTTTAPPSTTTVPAPPDGVITRVTDGDTSAFYPAVSDDGRYVAYYSRASNLVPEDTNGVGDIFMWDRETDTTTRITDGNDWSRMPDISADGRYVTFDSRASNLVPGDTNGFYDVFVWDRDTGTTIRITDGNDDSEGPVISADGKTIAFTSRASNLAPEDVNYFDRDVFVWNAAAGTTTRITDSVWYLQEDSFAGDISTDGRYVTFTSHSSILVPNDTNEREDVFLWDSVTGTITRVSEDQAQNPSVSADGRFVVYDAQWGGTQVFLWDATTGQTTHITESFAGGSNQGGISADGRYITLQSWAPNLVPDDTNGVGDVFVWDHLTGKMTRITDGDGNSWNPTIAADGGSIAFDSEAGNLVPDDGNGVGDVFVWERPG